MNTERTKKYYKIREAADYIGVPQSTLRFWEKEFETLKPRRSSHNQRYYTPDDLDTLQIIRYLLHIKGLKVEAAKEYLKHNRKNVSKKVKVIEKLVTVKGELEEMLKVLNLRAQKLGI